MTLREFYAKLNDGLAATVEFLDGKKTYLVMGATIATAIADAEGWAVPKWIYPVELALFGGAIRAGVGKAQTAATAAASAAGAPAMGQGMAAMPFPRGPASGSRAGSFDGT